MQEAGSNVKNLAAMFEKKATLKPEPFKKGVVKKDDIPASQGTSNVANMAAMFEKNKTVNLDQDKKKFVSNTATTNTISNNPFVKN